MSRIIQRSVLLTICICIGIISVPLAKGSDLFNSFGIGILTTPKCGDLQIPLYESENGEEPGAFLKQKLEHGSNYFVFVDNDGKELNLHQNDDIDIGYEEIALTVFDETNYGFKVVKNQSNGEGYWISKTDVKRYHLSHWTWMDFLSHNFVTLFPEAIGIPMNLRSEPSANGEKIITMNKDTYQISLTGETKGLWAKVSVSFYSGSFCEEAELIRKYKGWVKLLDDKGYPNLWFYAKGC